MAIVLYEKGKGEAISVARIQGEFGNQFQITGSFTVQETTDLALLIRSGSLAAPMEIIEERTIGPSLGKENIERGFRSTLYGFTAIAVFMILYYRVFGLISVVALSVNVMLLIALLSMLQATMTLPGIAAVALTLGMAIDANVLINERVREELRNGRTPQQAITEGYDKAFATILDSNVTTLIAGIALLTFGSGPVRGLRDRALARHPDLDLLRGVRVAGDRQPRLRLPQEAAGDLGRPDLEAGRPWHDGETKRQSEAPWNSSASAARFRSCGIR